MESSYYRGLAFLLSLGLIPACGGDDTEDAASTETTTSGSGTTDAAGEPTTGAETGGTTGEALTPCEAKVEREIECLQDGADARDALVAACERYQVYNTLYYVGLACFPKIDAWLLCLANLPCEQVLIGAGEGCEQAKVELDTCESPLNPTCVAFGQWGAECGVPSADQWECDHTIFKYGWNDPECGAALEEVYACFSELPCGAIDGACVAESMKRDDVCGTGGQREREGASRGRGEGA